MVRCSCVALFYCSLSLSHTHTHSIFGEIDINTAHIVGFTFAGRVLLIVFMWSVWWLLHIVQFPHVVVTADAVFLPPPPPALSSLNVRYSFRNYFKYNLIFLVTCLHTTMESVRYKWMFVIFTYATIIVMYNIRILMLNILALSLSVSVSLGLIRAKFIQCVYSLLMMFGPMYSFSIFITFLDVELYVTLSSVYVRARICVRADFPSTKVLFNLFHVLTRIS